LSVDMGHIEVPHPKAKEPRVQQIRFVGIKEQVSLYTAKQF